jgi:Leucine-rich repeat (LRR) protein
MASSIDLSRKSLKHIPKQIFSLSTLTCLDVSRNSLQGIPPEIKHLHNLVKLIALSNHLRLRQLPLDELSSLRHLRLLDLRYNRKLKQAALDTLNEVLILKNLHLEILCTHLQERHTKTKLSACD